MKTSTQEMDRVKEFLNADPKNKIRLASFLGHTTTQAFPMWFKRKRLPHLYKDKIMEFILENDFEKLNRRIKK